MEYTVQLQRAEYTSIVQCKFAKGPVRRMLPILHAFLSAPLLLCVTLSLSDSLHFRLSLESLEVAFI